MAERLSEGDATLWGPAGTPEVANRLGWLTIAERDARTQLRELESFAAEVIADGLQDVVLLGMGGSSLAPEVLCAERSARQRGPSPALHVLDSTDAATIRAVQAAIDLERTLFVVSSKSGGTIEPLSLFAHFFSRRRATAQLRRDHRPRVGSWPSSPREHGFRHTFFGDPDIGGRYSALSPFGIVPAALIGRRRPLAADRRGRGLGRLAEVLGDESLGSAAQPAACGWARRWPRSPAPAATSSRS